MILRKDGKRFYYAKECGWEITLPHIENINDFSKKEELYKMHEIIKKNSVPY